MFYYSVHLVFHFFSVCVFLLFLKTEALNDDILLVALKKIPSSLGILCNLKYLH